VVQTERSSAEIERLVQSVDRLVWQLAHKAYPSMPVYVTGFMDVEDLYAEGMRILCHKAKIWDPERSRFTTFAHTVVWSHLYKVRQRWMAQKRDSGPLISLDAPVCTDDLLGSESAQRDVPADLRTDVPVSQAGGASGYEDYLVMDAVVAQWFDAESPEV